MTKDYPDSMSGMLQRVIDALVKAKEQVEQLEEQQTQQDRGAGITALPDTAIPIIEERHDNNEDQIKSETQTRPSGIAIEVKIQGKQVAKTINNAVEHVDWNAGSRCMQ
jgi:uncharacterized protein Yka (UPF0111/DUF47 family)